MHTQRALDRFNRFHRLLTRDAVRSPFSSAVLFLMGLIPGDRSCGRELCLILNKRSGRVKQAGDLCFPGGSISPLMDACFAALLYLPGSPLFRWPYWSQWRRYRRPDSTILARLLATGLREGFEEMRLNPLRVHFLGPLPSQELVTFQRRIYPLVCWVKRQKRFQPNWEVEKIIRIPLKELLQPENYACLRLIDNGPETPKHPKKIRRLPCFLHVRSQATERLWGATYRMAMTFMDIVFGFKPPEMDTLPVVTGRLDEDYLTGRQ